MSVINDIPHEEMLEAAFYMIGNIDTEEDFRAWRKQFGWYSETIFNAPNGKAERAQKNSDIIWWEISNVE